MNDESMHPVGSDPSWSESYYFNFVDPVSKWGMFTRMGFRPHNGWADALHVIYLEGKRVAFTYHRRDIETNLSRYDGDLRVGDMVIECNEPHQEWNLLYDGAAQDLPDAHVLLTRSKARPDGWFRPARLAVDLRFSCSSEPHYVGRGQHGHFEQSGRVRGTITIDGQEASVDGYGIRDKSWGPRDWGAGNVLTPSGSSTDGTTEPFIHWFSMNFGDEAALGGSCFRQPDGKVKGEGWIQQGDTLLVLPEVVIESDFERNSIIHRRVVLRATTERQDSITIQGSVLNVCPTKIPVPGGAIFVNEGLTEFQWDDRQGYGISEHWHAVGRGS